MSQINETAIKTPGVYINEIPTLPPSVAQVSTAIPAFIGYTQKRDDEDGNPIPTGTIKPIKIFSLLEYEQFFGRAENEPDISVTISRTTSGTNFVIGNSAAVIASSATSPSRHNMYYSMRLYFDNGGGPCYIVSVGVTGGAITQGDLQAGLDAIEAY